MHPCTDDAFEWIRNRRAEFLPRDKPDWKSFVSNPIPKQFEAYAKILHQTDASYKNIDNPLTEREISILKIPPCTTLRSFVERRRKENLGPRIRWRELAQLFGVPFEAEICHEWFRARMEEPGCWPRFLLGPDDAGLNDEELSAVLSVLQPFAGNQDSFFRFSEIALIATEKPIQFCGTLDELSAFLATGKYQFTPEYWWPADHSWCVCSDYDLTFTLVAGCKELVSGVLNDATLEAIQVTPQTRIDDYAPMSTLQCDELLT
ncbi:MAG: hypothetical protein DMG40_06375 [Acidobacteria bacterium]|nr:MAG: hypothetical protein DMG40_06375 [Acidobacteriota bacterium]